MGHRRHPRSRGRVLAAAVLTGVSVAGGTVGHAAAAGATARERAEATVTWPATATAPGCEVALPSSVWRAPVDALPRHARSDAYVASIGADARLHPDFGSGLDDGRPFGIPVTVTGGNVPEAEVSFDYADESDPAGYRIPDDARVENGPTSDGDRHVVVFDRARCRSYELFDAHLQSSGRWHAGSGAVFDLRSTALRPDGWTSADAAGLPILPLLVRYDEVASGAVRHALRITVPRSDRSHVWPARHDAGAADDPDLPPMGLRLRLKQSVDTSGLPPQAKVVAEALKRYGAVVADNGSAWFVSGDQDERWDNEQLAALKALKGSDFEAVDTSSLRTDPDSSAARTP